MATTFTARLGRGAALTIAAGAIAFGAAGCSTIGPGAAPQPSESADGLGEEPGPTGTPAPAGSGKGGGKGDGKGRPGGNHNGGGNGRPTPSPTATATTPSGPRIAYFRVKQKAKCPQGTNVYPVPGVPLVIEWKVERAHQVALSVDGPGVYNTYGAEGSETFMFSCGGAPGTTETHKYTIKTVGGGDPVSKTITASAVVYEIAQV
ncbi:MAG TPA: hypothetical protein VFR67_18935 [Pilimelia sp.]|nr:hypothetical protein [Pilimelia sp.]